MMITITMREMMMTAANGDNKIMMMIITMVIMKIMIQYRGYTYTLGMVQPSHFFDELLNSALFLT